MSKTIFLHVSGADDYGALIFEQNFNEQKVYEDMVRDGKKSITLKIENDDGYTDEIYVKIKEFGEVDSAFVSFMCNELCDYDQLKSENIYEVFDKK